MMADTFTSGITAQFPDMVAPSGISTGDETLHVDMRQLWEDHVTWTRVFLIDAIAGLPDTDVATARLLQNQVDIGNAVKPFYGNAAGDQLTVLLKAHITLAAAVVAAATAQASHGDALQQAEQRWYANADQIAAFLANANPKWKEADLKTMMHEHLNETLAEATARIQANWSGDVKDYDVVEGHILDMADMLSDGIDAQMPSKVDAL